MKNRFRLKRNKLYIFPLSDLHLGSPNCDLDYFYYWEDVFNNTRTKHKIIYLLGDLIDMQNLRIGAWEQNLSANEQIYELIDLLKPYKKYINFMTQGNHPRRVKKDYNMDVGKLVSDILNIRYDKSDFFDKLNINNNDFVVYGKHGNRFSSRLELAQGGMIRDATNIDADLLMCGHNHYCSYFNRPIQTKDGIRRKHYAFTGHFLEYKGSYANERNMNHVPQGFMRIGIDRHLNVHTNEYHKDMVYDIWNNKENV